MTKNMFAVKRGGAAGNEKYTGEREKTKTVQPEGETEGLDERERAEFENERRSYIAEKLEFHAKKALSEEQLPVSFAKLLCGASEEETLENIAVFKEEFMKAVEAALSEKLKGSTPRTAAAQTDFDPFLNGFGM